MSIVLLTHDDLMTSVTCTVFLNDFWLDIFYIESSLVIFESVKRLRSKRTSSYKFNCFVSNQDQVSNSNITQNLKYSVHFPVSLIDS